MGGRGSSGVLAFAILGLLHESPLHGYELRKRLNASLGNLRAISYGSLYPALRALQGEGLITVDDNAAAAKLSSRSRVVYILTADGKARALRRAAEIGAAVDVTEADQARRDRLDAAQSAKAGDAILINATALSLPAVIAEITRLAQERTQLACAGD